MMPNPECDPRPITLRPCSAEEARAALKAGKRYFVVLEQDNGIDILSEAIADPAQLSHDWLALVVE